MRVRIPLLFSACLLLAAVAGLASAKPNFTGSWELDQSKSHSVNPTMKQWLTVTHTGDKIVVEVKTQDQRGETTVKDEYTLDGKETEFTQPAPPNAPPNTPPTKGKRKSSWMPNDKGVLIEEEVQRQTPEGPFTLVIARKWMMWPDGTMSVEVIQDTPRGTFNSRRVFVKK